MSMASLGKSFGPSLDAYLRLVVDLIETSISSLTECGWIYTVKHYCLLDTIRPSFFGVFTPVQSHPRIGENMVSYTTQETGS